MCVSVYLVEFVCVGTDDVVVGGVCVFVCVYLIELVFTALTAASSRVVCV